MSATTIPAVQVEPGDTVHSAGAGNLVIDRLVRVDPLTVHLVAVDGQRLAVSPGAKLLVTRAAEASTTHAVIDIDINTDGMHSVDQLDQADLVAASLYELGAEVVLVGVTSARCEVSDPEAARAIRKFVQDHVRLALI
jgi:hypothetical protein